MIGADLPHTDQPSPTWDQQINQQCSIGFTTPVGHKGGLSAQTLRTVVTPGDFGAAMCYGTGTASDHIAQGGPNWTTQLLSENPAMLKISGAGMWSVLNARVQIPSTWTTSMGLADSRSIATYTGSYHDIACQIISNAVARGALPIDVPPLAGGTQSMTYNGFDLISAGQRLQELTQLDGGPDIYFRPYFAAANVIRWEAVIGNPTITNTGNPLLFDHGSNLVQCLPTADGTKRALRTFVKGNGTEAAIAWAFAQDVAAITGGKLLLEMVDTNHSDVTDQTTLNAIATADQGLNGKPVETWDATARIDGPHALGTYGPGVRADYNFTCHPWIPPGRYTQRLLGMSSGSNDGEIKHIIQAMQGAA
ncbi:MAG TPA: hypothetical protein VHX38_02170 [Pseudonocardiaceae bacterium]|nr:hypothetical protein [Pseudonocardiaceae bacterium]